MTVISSKSVISFFFYLAYVQKQSLCSNASTRKWPTGGVLRELHKEIRRHIYVDTIEHPEDTVPDTFDARQKWPYCKSIGRILDQGECNFCWAVATATVLTDRLCIMTKGEVQFQYSAEDLLACCTDCSGASVPSSCEEGGFVLKALNYLSEHGTVSGDESDSEGCRPISANTIRGVPPVCQKECTNPNHNKTHNQQKRYSKRKVRRLYETVSVKQVQLELMANGPVILSMQTTSNFMTDYTNEIFQRVYYFDELEPGYHGVRLIGWGEEDGIPYWLVANSWGDEWGYLGGFFKIIRGENFMDVESDVIAPFASLTKEGNTESKAVLFYTHWLYAYVFFTFCKSLLLCHWA